MRVVGGALKGRKLAALGKGDPAAHLRPTTDRVRESLFNVLGGGRFGDPIQDARVLDVFAGTGALGIEALSRGARTVTFMDSGRRSLGLIRRNIDVLGISDAVDVIPRDATKIGANSAAPYDLVFLDPPYGKMLGQKALAQLLSGHWIADSALILLEENSQIDAPAGFKVLDARNYGDTTISFLRADGSPE